MIKISSESFDAGNRSVVPPNVLGGQAGAVSAAGLQPFTPVGLKPIDKSEAQAAVKPSAAEMKSALEKLNDFVSTSAQAVEFVLDQESNRTVVKVIDSETKRVLRQFPNEEALAMSKTLDKLQGLMIKQTA